MDPGGFSDFLDRTSSSIVEQLHAEFQPQTHSSPVLKDYLSIRLRAKYFLWFDNFCTLWNRHQLVMLRPNPYPGLSNSKSFGGNTFPKFISAYMVSPQKNEDIVEERSPSQKRIFRIYKETSRDVERARGSLDWRLAAWDLPDRGLTAWDVPDWVLTTWDLPDWGLTARDVADWVLTAWDLPDWGLTAWDFMNGD